MQKDKSANVKEQLLKLEKLVKKVIRKSLKNNTLDYTVQFSVSSLEPGKVKYSSMISSPGNQVQPILFTFDSFNLLEAALKEAETAYNPTSVELAFHESRINTFKAKIEQHEARVKQLEDPEYKAEDDIPMEKV